MTGNAFISPISLNTMANIKRLCFLLLYFSLSSITGYSQIEKVIVETYYISDQLDSTDVDGGKLEIGSVTYRVYVDLKPGNKLLKIYGDANHALKFSSTKPFFNNVDGVTFAKDLNKNKYFNNTVALDTWLTLGQSAKILGGKTNFGVLKPQDNDGSFIGGINNNGGSASIPGGLLTNTITTLGIPLTIADGMDTMINVPTSWTDYGIKDFITGIDTSMFGSLKTKSEFISRNAFLKNSGVKGVIPDSNQILIAQLTTKGSISFEINLEVEQLVNNVPTIIKYVANDSVLLSGEKKSSFLKYPFSAAICGCKDPNYLEYDPNLECANNSLYCLNKIVFGCMDVMACNYDAAANFSIPNLCCYPGSCSGRDISVVCPSINGTSFNFDFYPNPCSSSIFINVTSGIKKQTTYSIYNSFGTLVLESDLGITDRIAELEIDLSTISSGLYLIRLDSGDDYLSKQFFKN